MNYGTIKDDYGNIKRCVSFKLIETITVYNRGQMFDEYTRFPAMRVMLFMMTVS